MPVYFFSEISMVALVFSQSRYMWQPVPISWKEMVKFSTGAAVLETLMSKRPSSSASYL